MEQRFPMNTGIHCMQPGIVFARRRLAAALSMALLGSAFHAAQASTASICADSFSTVASARLPDGWQSIGSAGAPAWSIVSMPEPGLQHAAHVVDAGSSVYESSLITPAFAIPAGGLTLSLQQRMLFSWANTAGVLEISVADGAWRDIVEAGGQFLQGGYSVRSFVTNPIGYRAAWGGGARTDLLTTVIRLPSASAGKSARLRFRLGSSGTGDSQQGWYLFDMHCDAPSASPALHQTAADEVGPAVRHLTR